MEAITFSLTTFDWRNLLWATFTYSAPLPLRTRQQRSRHLLRTHFQSVGFRCACTHPRCQHYNNFNHIDKPTITRPSTQPPAITFSVIFVFITVPLCCALLFPSQACLLRVCDLCRRTSAAAVRKRGRRWLCSYDLGRRRILRGRRVVLRGRLHSTMLLIDPSPLGETPPLRTMRFHICKHTHEARAFSESTFYALK